MGIWVVSIFLAAMDNAAMNSACVDVYVHFLCYVPRSGVGGSDITLCLTF